MTNAFLDTLPKDLIVNVRSMCGQAGEEWLRSLPQRISTLERQWNITAGKVFDAAGINYVAPAVDSTGYPCVLKINPPYDNSEFASEAAYLRFRDGNGCVRLLKQNTELRAMLIERAMPGQTMDVIFGGREPECISPAIDVLLATRGGAPPEETEAIDLDDWFHNLRRHEGTAFPSAYGQKALEIYSRLGGERMYLHGDFHPRNIVSADRVPFLLIDPKGIIGDIGYDIAVFLNNYHWWQEDRPDVTDRLDRAVAQFAHATGMTEKELREWAFAQMVISAWWTYDELPDVYQDDVTKADIWRIL